jgi:antitoxin HicB
MKIDRKLILSYPFTIRPLIEEEGGGFMIEYPDLPGCVSDGETLEEALRNGADAVKSYLLSCAKHGDPFPRRVRRAGNGGRECHEAFTPAWLRERARKVSVSIHW